MADLLDQLITRRKVGFPRISPLAWICQFIIQSIASVRPFKAFYIYLTDEIERWYSSQSLHGISVNLAVSTPDCKSTSRTFSSPCENLPEVQRKEKSQQVAAKMSCVALSRDWEGKGVLFLWHHTIQGPFKADNTHRFSV